MLDDRSLEDLLNRGAPPPRVTLLHSLRLEFEPAVLARLLAAALHGRGVRVVGEDDADPAIERLRVIDFMEWSNGQGGPVQLEVFPAGEYGMEDLVSTDDEPDPDDDAWPDLPF